MKTRPLPDLDLARIAPLPTDQKWHELKLMKLGYPPYSYQPTRRSQLEILNVDAGPLGIVPRAPWAQIAEEISKRARTDAEKIANLTVAHALYNFADDHSIAGRRHEFFSLAVGLSGKVSYWVPAVISVDGRPTIPFIDPRRGKKLTREGRRFAFSVMHERIRAADPDFSEVELAIIQFGTHGKGESVVRTPNLHTATGVKLFDFDTVDAMVRETYEIWHAVLTEREAEARRKGTGTTGPLGV
ncbi:type VI toxin-antitoxin system SocB family DNA replication inhibitor toxin [Methylocystis rosea]|uniref:Uncharacterized protein n=1 Tax=Methylocystis rosea TaxID=173366 RepID=A0A3G8M2X2_9HYPH|nr:hypothetical protein [Methylocystis rosea]AZG76319.1 hypothetical protein EHO51_06020 [Methylocystis rosea]